jgi:hypothetical protein
LPGESANEKPAERLNVQESQDDNLLDFCRLSSHPALSETGSWFMAGMTSSRCSCFGVCFFRLAPLIPLTRGGGSSPEVLAFVATLLLRSASRLQRLHALSQDWLRDEIRLIWQGQLDD